MNLSVVPEFSTFTTSWAALGSVPKTLMNEGLSSSSAPMALHALMVAKVSLEISGLKTLLAAADRLAITIALCV